MGHQLNHYMWQDGLPLKEGGPLKKKLCRILFDQHYSLHGAAIAYGSLITEHRFLDLKTSAGYLGRAKNGIFNYRKNPMQCFATN